MSQATTLEAPTAPTHSVVRVEGGFKVLNLRSMCAYGSFETREEAEAAISESARADQLARCGQ